jgi:phage tail-like protein
MALLSQTALRSDPLLNHNFVVSLIDTSSTLAILGSAALSAVFDVALGGFAECSGLEMSLKTEDYREGGANGAVLHFPSRVEWGAITLKKGVGSGTALWDWHYGFVEGTGKRRDGVIVLLNDEHLPNNIWYFRRGLPTKYTGPALNATQNTVAIESIEIAHEGIYQVPFVGAITGAVSAVAGTVGGLL